MFVGLKYEILIYLIIFLNFVVGNSSYNAEFSQSYNEIMSINSLNQFKRVMIENYYEFDSEDDEVVIYGLNIQRDSIEGNKSSNWALFIILIVMLLLFKSVDKMHLLGYN